MQWYSPKERRSRRRRLLVWLGAGVLALVVISLLDRPAYRFFNAPETEGKEWYKLLRIVGYFPTWVLIGLALDFGGRKRTGRFSDGILLMAGAGLSGAAAEIMKLVIGRQRPGPDGEYIYRGLFAGFRDGSNLGMPSSHAAVAFGGAFMLSWLRPGTGPLVLACAAGCALTRLLGGDHFLSDVTVGAAVGYAVARVIAGAAGALPARAWRYG
jgi:membrane-associated phospholipid phosphatase